DVAAASLDHVAAGAVVARDQAPAGDDPIFAGRAVEILHRHLAVRPAREKGAERLDVVLGQVELRHHLLDPLGGVGARRRELVVRPVVPRLRDVGPVAEEELLPGLRAEGGELDADARLVLHARDVVAAGAAVLADELLARLGAGRAGEPGLELRGRGPLLAQRRGAGRDWAPLVVGGPEARHATPCRIAARYL